MDVSGEDLELAKTIANQIGSAGNGQIRRVIMLGSRATGDADPTSDLDVVAVVEPTQGARGWGAARLKAERTRIMDAILPLPVRVDLWIRTVDQYHEGKGVIGGFENLAESEGMVLFSRPLRRRPVARRSPDQVRRSNIRAWLHDAHVSLRKAAHASTPGAVVDGGPERDAAYYSWRCIQRCMTAVLVCYQVPSSKKETLDDYLEKIDRVVPRIGEWLRHVLDEVEPSVSTAQLVLEDIVGWLDADPRNRPYLAPLLESLREPLIYFSQSGADAVGSAGER